MTDELRPCPFCGQPPHFNVYASCVKHTSGFYVKEWNTRPIEDALRKQLEGMESDYESACVLVAKMHEAAVGGIRGPIAGVVEDVLNLRTKLDVAVEAIRDDVLILLHEIQSSQKGSIGSIDNTYLPQMSRRNIDAMEKRINNALAEIRKDG